MTSRWPLGMILMSTLVISCTMPLRAGTFRLFDLSYEVWTLPNNYREIRVLVGARAIYKGKVDREDMDANWVINTHLNTTMYWKVPDVAQLQTLLPVGTCETGLDYCWDPALEDVEFHRAGVHWSRSDPPYLEYCPSGVGCVAHGWSVALGPGEFFGANEYGRTPERIWWRENQDRFLTYCVRPNFFTAP